MPISPDSIRRAVSHLSGFGDTDIFPPPFEFAFYESEIDKISVTLSNIDAGQHVPTSAFECLCPKGYLSFRIAHQLFPVDTLLYTAAVLEIAPALEQSKLDAKDGPFSYRFIDEAENPRLFSESSNYHDWLAHVREIFTDGGFEDQRYVLETDISDFYSRIYFHRLEHILDDANAPNQIRKLIEKIIKSTRARQSHGLPVGSSASRILAEALLSDTDQMISAQSTAYSRYVDDFRIVVNHQSEVHTLLCRLAEHLMLTEGLSLNASKTKTYTTEEGRKAINRKLTDVFNDDEIVRINQFIRSVYSDEDVSVEDIEDVEPKDLIKKLSEVYGRDSVDYNSIKVILKALRAVEVEDPLSLVSDHIELLYHTPRDFCILIGGMAQRKPDLAEGIAALVVNTITQNPYKEMALSRIWVAHLFATQALPITSQIREKMNLTNTTIERRIDLILRGLLRDRAYFRAQKTKFDEVGSWEKPALMIGASCLSTSEYGTWLDTIKDHVSDPLANEYRKWLIDNQDEIFDKISVDYRIKTRAEKIAEAFGPS